MKSSTRTLHKHLSTHGFLSTKELAGRARIASDFSLSARISEPLQDQQKRLVLNICDWIVSPLQQFKVVEDPSFARMLRSVRDEEDLVILSCHSMQRRIIEIEGLLRAQEARLLHDST